MKNLLYFKVLHRALLLTYLLNFAYNYVLFSIVTGDWVPTHWHWGWRVGFALISLVDYWAITDSYKNLFQELTQEKTTHQ